MEDGVSVSVVLPAYNRAKSIHRAMSSVLGQTHPNLELIVVDDASTDETCEVVSSIRDKRIRLIRHSRNRGASAARNTGIAVARHPLVAFQDSDDSWRPDKLVRQVHAFREAPPHIGVVFSQMATHKANGDTVVTPTHLPSRSLELDTRGLLWANFVGTPTAVVQRRVLDLVGGFDEELRALEDWELWIRVSQRFGLLMIAEPLVDVHPSPNSISRNEEEEVAARACVITKHESLYFEVQGGRCLLSRQQRKVGLTHFHLGKAAPGRYFLHAAMRNCPSMINVSLFLLSLFGRRLFSLAAPLILRLDRLIRSAMRRLRVLLASRSSLASVSTQE